MDRHKKHVKRGKRISKDGKVYYYYYKLKMGRPKKPGPKKKKPIKEPKPRTYKTWDFIIVRCRHNKQTKYIGRYHDLIEVYAEKERLEEQNAKIVFPKQLINNGRNNPEVYENKDEYLILKRKGENDTSPQLRNEFGKLVDHTTNSKDWIVYDKFPYLEEETFWAYGFDQKNDRKTFDWIAENFVKSIITDTYNIVNIYLYNNKVMFRYDNREFNFVICKNVSDAIRMYNLLQERFKKDKKQVIFTGHTTGFEGRGAETIELIRQKTGWKNKKIWEKSTRH